MAVMADCTLLLAWRFIMISQRDLESCLRQTGSMGFTFMFSAENSTKIILTGF